MSSEKIKIFYILSSLGVGGLERQLIAQLPFFDQNRFDITLLSLRDCVHGQHLYDEVVGYAHLIKMDFQSYADLSAWWSLRKHIGEVKPHILVSSMFTANTITRIMSLWTGIPSIAREHNTHLDKGPRHFLMDRVLSVFNECIVAVSSGVAEFASQKAHIPRDKFRVINNGINIEDWAKRRQLANSVSVERVLGLPANARIILNIARLKKQKNQAALIEAFVSLHARFPDWYLVIIGDGQERDNLRKMVEQNNCSGRVILAGSQREVCDFYARADFFVLSSLIEGFPNVILEAMAMGLPVIATNVAGVKELTDSGWAGQVVHGSGKEVLTEAMSEYMLMSDAAKTRLCENAIETVSHFDIRKFVLEYEKLFEKIANNQVKN